MLAVVYSGDESGDTRKSEMGERKDDARGNRKGGGVNAVAIPRNSCEHDDVIIVANGTQFR
jgi:hypothetical protein